MTAGVAALVLQAHPDWDAKKLRDVLLQTAQPIQIPDYPDAPRPNNLVGFGLVDSYNAIHYEEPQIGPFGEDKILTPYPNPFRPERDKYLRIPISLSHDTPTTLSIYTLSGERVKKIELSESESHVGVHTIEWDGKNDKGMLVAPGTYIILLYNSYGNSDQKKIAVLR